MGIWNSKVGFLKHAMTLDKYCLKWDNFRLNAVSTFSELRADSDFSDMTLACDDRSVRVHRVVLAMGSMYFMRLLRQVVHPHPLVYMRGVQADTLEALLDFLYLGEASLGEEQLNTFLTLAKELEVKGLDADGEEFKADKKETSNCEMTNKVETFTEDSYITLDAEEEPLIDILNKNQIMKNKETLDKSMAHVNSIEKFEEATAYYKTMQVFANNLLTEFDLIATTQSMMEKVGKNWTCKVCGKTTGNHSGHMRDHVEYHIEGLQIMCNICGHSNRSSCALRTHISAKHRDNKSERATYFHPENIRKNEG